MTETEILHMAELNVLCSGHLKTEYSQLKTLPIADRTWFNFIGWWKEKVALWKTLNMPAGQYGYRGGAIDETDEIDNMNAATNATNAAIFQQLTNSNNALVQQLQILQAQNAQLLTPTPEQSTSDGSFAIMDSGTTSNFFTTDANVINIPCENTQWSITPFKPYL
jgi:hypothetical protein